MTTTAAGTATFDTTITGSATKTGIPVPEQAIVELGAGKRPAVHVDLNGYRYRSTVAVMGGQYLVGVSAAVREATRLRAGDSVRVTLRVAEEPRDVDVPADLAAALAADETAGAFFATLSNSLQRYHVDMVNAAKTEQTRQRRIEKAVALFRAGRKR